MSEKVNNGSQDGRPQPSPLRKSPISLRWCLAGLAGLLALHFLQRLWLVLCPSLGELNYDEAIIGLMTLDALRGNLPTFIWGQAYMGPLDAYFAVPWVALFGSSSFVMRISMIIMGSILMVAVYGCASLAGGRRSGLMAALYWAVPPLFLAFITTHVSGGHLAAITGAGLFMWGACRLSVEPLPRHSLLIAFGAGLAAGLGWWASLLCAFLVLGGGVGMLLVRPRLILKGVPWLMGLGFFIGSFPFWWWNLTHSWMTFDLLQGGGDFWRNLSHLYENVWFSSLVGGWWADDGVSGQIHPGLMYVVLALVYLPCALYIAYAAARWLWRAVRLRRPFEGPEDILLICLFAVLISHANSSYGSSDNMRYALVMYPPAAALLGIILAKVWRNHSYLAMGLVLVLAAFNLSTVYFYRQEHQHLEAQPMGDLIASMDQRGITHAYSHARTAFTLCFESRGRIKAADYFGLRNLELLEQVRESAKPAIFTSYSLGSPPPDDWDKALKSLGAPHERHEKDDYVMWYDFAQLPPMTPIATAEIKAEVRGGTGGGQALLDRNLYTQLKVPGGKEAQVRLDLGRELKLARLSLLPGRNWRAKVGHFVSMKLESSLDGSSWQTRKQGDVFQAGLTWENRQARLSVLPLVELNFSAQPVRYLRLTLHDLRAIKLRYGWEISELYVYEAKKPERPINPAAVEAKKQAGELIKLWASEPKGPISPHEAAIKYWRRDQVDWPLAVRLLDKALEREPGWEAAMRLMLEAFDLGELSGQQVSPRWNAAVLEPNRSASFQNPELAEALWLTGNGKVNTGMLSFLGGLEVRPDKPRLLPLNPGEQTPSLDCLEGQILATRIRGVPILAEKLLQAGMEKKAKPILKAVMQAKSIPVMAALDLAGVLAAQGRKDEARQVLHKAPAEEMSALRALAADLKADKDPPPGSLQKWLGLSDRTGHDLASNREAEETHARIGRIAPDQQANGDFAVRAMEGTDQPGELKVWLESYFKKGPYVARFRVRTRGRGEMGVLKVHRHYDHNYDGLIKEIPLVARPDELGWFWVEMPIIISKEPVKLEAGVAWNGKGELWIDRIQVEPDLRQILLDRVGRVEDLLP